MMTGGADEDERLPLLQGQASPQVQKSREEDRITTIEIDPSPGTGFDLSSPLFPDETLKTVLAAVFLAICFFVNTLALVLTHQRLQHLAVGDREPLPDILLDNLPTIDLGLDAAEIIIMVSVVSTVGLLFLHRYRWILFRRVFFIMGVLYLMRAVTMYVTVLPVASYTYYCSPKMNSTSFGGVVGAAFRILSGFGLSINGMHTYCGDYMYSGHTVILVTTFLVIQEYSPRRSWRWVMIHWVYWTLSIAGIFLVVLSRGHYTIDILAAYYVTTRTFWMYHSLAGHQLLKETSVGNFLGKLWWFRIFGWLEGRVHRRVPHHYSVPFLNAKIINLDFEPEEPGSEPDLVPVTNQTESTGHGKPEESDIRQRYQIPEPDKR